MAGLAYAGQHSDSVFGTGTLDVARYGRLLKSRQLVGVRGAGLPFDGLYYVKSVTHDIKRGEYKQSFTLARNGARLDRCRRCRHERRVRFYGKYRGTVINNIDPLQIGRIQAIVPDVARLRCRRAGRCRACRSPASTWACSRCRRSAPASGSSSSAAIPTIRSGSAATGAARPRRRRCAKAVPPGRRRHHAADAR